MPTTTATELGQSSTILTTAILATTAATPPTVAVQPCSDTTTATSYHQATTTVSCQQLSMHQLQEDATHCSRMPLAHPWSINRRAHRRVLQHGLATPTTTVDDIPIGEEVLAGTFFLNERPFIILFSSGASHDFISSTCAMKAMLSMVATEAPYVISAPGGREDADRIVHKTPIKLAGRVFSTDLIILKGQGLDVILGMSWMKLHKAILDIAGRLVHLNSPVYGKVVLHLHVISRIKASLYNMAELKLDDIHVIQEFPDKFLDDLPRMPPERVIEFKIEL
jgi:hypothetical protein